MPSLDEIKERAVPWGILFLRIIFSLYLFMDGACRVYPQLIEKASKGAVVQGFFGMNSAGFVIVGVCELLFGLLAFVGLYMRVALIPVLLFSLMMLFKQFAVEGIFISPVSSASEEYYLLSGIAASFIIMGPGRLSLQKRFSNK